LPGEKYELELQLPSRIFIRVLTKVVRSENDSTAFEFVSMDPDSFYHLHNLIRLNSSNPDIIEQELYVPAFDLKQIYNIKDNKTANKFETKAQSNFSPYKEAELMFRHILVPTDCTEQSKPSLDIAVQMHEKSQLPNAGQRITLLHVIETISGTPNEEFDKFYEKLQKRAQRKMEELLKEHKDKDLELDTKILLGNRVQEIINFVLDNEVSLVIMASHQIDQQNPAQGWGTISHKISILASCPVMLVK
jgi:nucleotide-binding universal stress UspA family protein